MNRLWPWLQIWLVIVLMRDMAVAQPSAPLVVLFTGNNTAQISDCGCGPDPAGGLLRLATAVDSLRRQYPDAVFIDSGDWLSSYANSEQDRQALAIVKRLQYDALAVGEYEWPGFKPYLRSGYRKIGLPLVLTNAHIDSVIRNQIVLRRGRWGVRVVAFLEPELARRKSAEASNHAFADIRARLRRLVRSAVDRREMLIAIFHQFGEVSHEILNLLPETSLIIRGHWHRRFAPERDGLQRVAGRWVANPGDNGEYLGMAIFDLEKKRWSANFIRLNRRIPEDAELAKKYMLDTQQ
ncbi:MAG: hypothetical protein Q9P90_00730 [candidate division KSB1 bacterium]|nr:hypothetical protein [candidate division KSB1 bacterium]